MGQFLTILSRQKRNRSQLEFFYNHSLTKIAEFYQQYKSISDTLAMDDSEFSQIFGQQNLKVFQILDTDKNLLIDGLELFAGLVLYSKIIKFSDKVQFLFNLFDFNEQNSLFPNDIEFMFLSCCTFTHKIYSLRSQLDQVWIEQFVRGQFFNGQIKINISQILKWAKQSAFITILFEEILERPISDNSSVLDKKIYIKTFTQPELSQQNESAIATSLNDKIYEKFISKAKQKFQTFHQEKIQYLGCDVLFDTKWVYGIRVNDIKKVMRVIYDKRKNLQIVYLVGKIAVIYKLKSKSQRHYRQHKFPLISQQINQARKLVATGQKCDNAQIRVWSYQTLQTKHIIKTHHKNGVHQINFSKDGMFILHVGCNSEGSFNIHSLITNELIYSLFCSTPIVDITELQNFTNVPLIQSLVTGLYDINHILLSVNAYMQAVNIPQTRKAQIQIKQHIIQACEFSNDGKPVSKITCSAFYFLNRNFSYLNEYDQTYNKYILTGHQQGQVNVWNSQYKSLQFQLCQQKSQIIKIVITSNYVIIVSDSSYVSFWDIAIERKQRRKLVDITQISYHLHSYNIRDLVPLKDQNQYLICTSKGDVFVLGKEIKGNEITKFSLLEKDYEVELIQQIFPIEGNIVGCKLRAKSLQGKNYEQLFYGGDQGIIFTVNAKTHLKVSAWNIGQKIVHFDVNQSRHHGTIIVAATQSNKIYTKIGHVESTDKIQIKDNIAFILMSPDTSTLVVSTTYYEQNNIMVFVITPKLTYSLTNTIPLPQKIVFMELIEKKSLLCVTENNSILLVSLKDLHVKPLDQIQRCFPNPVINMVYWLREKQNKYMPIVIGAQSKVLLMAKQDGVITAWKNQDELELGSKVNLYAHSSHCSSLILSQEQTRMYSSGYSDNLLLQWSLKFFIQKTSVSSGHLLKIQQIDEDQDEFLEREVAFCVFRNNLLTQMHDQHLLVRGIGSNNDTLSKLFKSMLQQWKLINQSYPNIKYEPNVGLKLDFVLGMQVFNKTQTVLSVRNRKIVYFVSRVVIIYDPSLNKQQIYTGHRFRVTCLHMLQRGGQQLMASGQSCYRPQIHIWSTSTLQTLKIIQTSHRWGIINITIQGQYLLSYGFKQSTFVTSETNHGNKNLNYLFQQVNIWSGQRMATLICKNPAYCMKINPCDNSEIVISTYGCVTFYQNHNRYFVKKSLSYVEDQHVTCIMFYQIKNGNKSQTKKQTDLLVGTRKGTIAMICQQNNFIAIKSKAHEQRINCLLKITVGKEMYFVTSSEDQTIKIWNRKFALMYHNEMKKNQSDQILKGNFDRKTNQVSYLRNRAVQSLTVFTSLQNKNPTLLLGTRNGDIFQMIIQTDFTEKDPFRNSKYLLYSKNNVTQSHFLETKKVLLAHHPKLQIIVTIGQDQNLLFWDTDASGGGNRFVFSKYIGYTSLPTAIKFSRDGDYLIIGFNDGLLIFLDSKISKSLQGKTDQKFLMPSLSLIKKQKAEQNNAILNIELSDSGQHLAVSYNYRIVTTKDKKNLSSNSFISLFNNKSRDKIKKFSKLDSGKIFQKFTSITCPYAQSIYKTEKNNQYGMAAYSMTFAEGQGKFYLLIYYQLIDCFQNRLNYSTDGKYSVWDVSTSTMIANLDLVGSLNWKKLCFQNSIFSKYVFWKNLIQYKGGNYEQQGPINNNLYIPHMSVLVNIPNHFIMGSVNGDLHIVKASALEFEGANPQQKDMFVAKTYPGHCSQVNQMQMNPEKMYIFTTSILDQCIFKYRIQGSTKLNTQDQSFYQGTSSVDIFSEVPSVENHQFMLSIYEEKVKLQSRKWVDTQNFLQKISIVEIIGRRASSVRQNLFIGCGHGITYHIGQSIIKWNMQTHVKKFICCNNSFDEQFNQITQLCISHDSRSAIASHSGLNRSTIVMWESNSKNILKQFYVNGISVVVLMSLNHDNSRMVIYGIDKKGKAALILIDFTNNKPLAIVSYAHKPVWVIKAIHFTEQSQSIFYTCGVQQTRKWTYSGNQLIYQQLQGDNSKDEKIIHLSMLVFNKTLVTGADDGSIFVWKNQILRKQQHDSMVTCLAKDRALSNNLFFSGGKDGNIIMWSLQPNTLVMLKRISILNILTPSQKHTSLSLKQISFNHQIQSINILNSQIVIGSRNGSIYYTNVQLINALHQDNPIKQLFSFHDFEVTQALLFSPEENRLYQISKDGLFSIWLIKEYKLLHTHLFRQETIDMGYHFKTNTIFIAFKKQLRVFYIEKEELSLNNVKDNSNVNINVQTNTKHFTYKLRQLPQLSISLKHITHLSFSNNEKMLALGIESNSDKSISIQIYQIPEDIRSSRTQLKKLFKISLSSQIQFIDFSLNNKFLLICLSDTVIIRDLAQSKNVNQQLISKIQWCSKGVVYGKQSESSINQWMKTWAGGVGRKATKGKFRQSSQLNASVSDKMKRTISGADKKEKLTLNRQSTDKKSVIKPGEINELTVSRLEGEKLMLIERWGSIYVYQGENLVSKLTLPITTIDHYNLSINKKYVAVTCEVDKMIIIVDISKCMSNLNNSKQ